MGVAAIDRELGFLQSELETLQGGVDSTRFLGADFVDYRDSLYTLAQGKGWTVTRSSNRSNIFYVKKTGEKGTRQFSIIINDNCARYEYSYGTRTDKEDYTDLDQFKNFIVSRLEIFERSL